MKTTNSALKQSILYGSSIALMKGISLLMLPFIANHLSAEDFGRLEVISTLAVIGSILVGMGLENALFRFAGTAKNDQQRKSIAADIFTLTLVIALVTAAACWFIAPHIAALIPTQPPVEMVRIVLMMLALEGSIAIPLAWLRMNEKATQFFIITCARATLQAALVLFFLYENKGVHGILLAGLLAALLQAFILSYWHIADTGIQLNRHIIKKCFFYSLPIVGSGLIAFALNGLDRWILADHASLEDVAQFGIAAKFALATILLMQPFGMWWLPKRFQVLNQTNGHQRFADTVTLGICLALFITLVVGLLSPLLIKFLLPSHYLVAAKYAIAFTAIMLFKELVELVNIGCFIGDTTRCQLVINIIGSVIGVGVMLALVPMYGVWGVLSALFIAQFYRFILFYLTSQHYLHLNYPIKRLSLLGIVTLTSLYLGSQFEGTGEQVILLCLTATVFFGLLVGLKLYVPACLKASVATSTAPSAK